MKISKDTINILKNFATISNNLRIYPNTNELTTISPQQSIFAKASIPDQFPKEVCIYELNSLLDLISYMENQEIEFGDKSLTIMNNGSTFEYYYASPDVIMAPPAGKSIDLDTFYQFTLNAADVALITKAAAISAAEQIIFKAENGKVVLHVGNQARSLTQSKVIGETDLTFNAILSVDNFKIIPDTYTVTLSKKKFLHFKSANTQTPQYWLALDPTSAV
jgi:hypothetical protein